MNYFVFPFESVPPDSRVVLYAAGVVGKHYYNQIKQTHYCDVVVWLDRYADVDPVKKPEAIKHIDSYDYDFVVIAVKDNKVAEEAKQILVSYGVPKSKIIHNVHAYTVESIKPDPVILIKEFLDSPEENDSLYKSGDVFSYSIQRFINSQNNMKRMTVKNYYDTGEAFSYSLESVDLTPVLTVNVFLNDLESLERALIYYFYKSDGDISYFNLFINEVKQLLSDCDNKAFELKKHIKERTIEIIETNRLSCEAKIVLLRVILKAECFSKELLKELVKLTGEITGNVSLKYWMLFDLSYIWFYYPETLYDGFFTDKKAIMRDYARELQLEWNPPEYTRKDNTDICVITISLDIETMLSGVMTIHISPIVRALSEKGYKLHVIDLGSFRNDSGTSFIEQFGGISRVPVRASREELLRYYPKDIELYYPFNATMKDRQQDVLNKINEIKPLCILDFSDEFSSISYYYSKTYPTIYFPLRAKDCSSSFFHKFVILSNDFVCNPPVAEEQVIRLQPFQERAEPKRAFYRAQYGLEESDIVVVTVGIRLLFDISDELAMQMCALIRQKPNIKWVIIGCEGIPYIKQHHEDLINKSIIFIEFEDDLPGIYGICDIYLNPERIGGGTSMILAMQHSLAVVSSINSMAALEFIEKDHLFTSETDLVPRIEQLSENHDLLACEKLRFFEISGKWDIDIFIDKLIQDMDELVKHF